MKQASSTPKKPQATPQPESNHQPPSTLAHWFDKLAGWWVGFSRFIWDVSGVILLALAAIILLGLFGLTRGSLLSPLVEVIRRFLGWGSYLAVAFVGGLGVFALRRRKQGEALFNFWQVTAFEIFAFTLMALLSMWGGQSLERADRGLDGGLVGWGLAYLVARVFPSVLGNIFLLVIVLISGLFTLGIIPFLVRRFESWLLAPPEDVTYAPIEHASHEDGTPAAPARADLSLASSTQSARDPGLPPLNLLSREETNHPDEERIHATAVLLEQTLAEFGIPAHVMGFRIGPTVTQFALEPGFVEKPGPDGQIIRQKVRVSQISALSRDLALALSAERLRIEAPVPGRSFVGIEVPNIHTTMVRLRPIMESETFIKMTSPLAVGLGADVSGAPVVADLTRMPHLLIAGTTGSGKSVCIAALTACLVMNNTPEKLHLALLDPKMVEMVRFNGLPHLLGKVETEIERMLGVLRWAIAEMDHRYRLLEEARVKDLDAYNRKMERRKQPALPRVVVMIDELADLMMSAPDQTEQCLVRLAQMARAVGIHLVVATQRPSTDVVTGLIKANFPARVSFTVATSIDSRVILDTVGAETLLGRGDMLFLNPEQGSPLRAQGAYVTDQEIDRIVSFWKKLRPREEEIQPPWEELISTDEEDSDALVKKAIDVVKTSRRASTSLLQRRLHIGYPRAARLIDELESLGVVGPAQGGGREREVLISADEAEDAGEVGGDEED